MVVVKKLVSLVDAASSARSYSKYKRDADSARAEKRRGKRSSIKATP